MKDVVVTMYNGEHGKVLRELTHSRHKRYADKCGADLVCADTIGGMTLARQMMHKMEVVRNFINLGTRVLWIDADILIHRNAPSLFDLVTVGLFGAVDEGALCDPAQLKMRCDHIVQTCKEEGIPVPDVKGRYFNCGMFLVNTHAELFNPRITSSSHDWCEQSLVNARLALSKVGLQVLPEAFNRFVYWGPKPERYWESSYFLHFAGPPSQYRRIVDMADASDRWNDL